MRFAIMFQKQVNSEREGVDDGLPGDYVKKCAMFFLILFPLEKAKRKTKIVKKQRRQRKHRKSSHRRRRQLLLGRTKTAFAMACAAAANTACCVSGGVGITREATSINERGVSILMSISKINFVLQFS